jgi:hypothetical protein
MLDEKLLKIFVSKIDAKLLKRICIEIFEAKNIQDANASLCVFGSHIGFEDCCVDLFDNVNE